MQALADSLETDRHHVLSCIKYEVLGKRPVYDSYKTFCERIENNLLGYPEFEFWYMRFYNGEVDLDCDRSRNPKPLELLELPVEVVEKVVEKLDLVSRLIIRNVCKPLRTIVDGCKLKFKSLHFHEYSLDAVTLYFGDNQQICYEPNHNENGTIITHKERTFQKKGVNLVDFAVNDLKTVMKCHNLELDSLSIDNDRHDSNLIEKAVNGFKEILDVSKTQLKVKVFEIFSVNPELIVPCLTLLKPGFLEAIHVNRISDKIANTEQWQHTKIGRLHNSDGMDPAGIKRFLHFERFFVRVTSMSAENMVQLREMLTSAPSFKKCKIEKVERPHITINMISTALGLPIQNQKVHVPIPGSTDVLAIDVFKACIDIERRSL